jgi:hypothetical protein
MARDAIARGKAEPPYAWTVPADQRDPARAAKMVGILRATGVEVKRAKSPFTAAGTTYPAGSWIFPASQPYRAHLKDMMERQVYPPRFAADGSAEPPYDVSGWTLPLQMGVRAVAVDGAFASDAEDVERVEPPRGSIAGPEKPAEYLIETTSDDAVRVVNDLLREGLKPRSLYVQKTAGMPRPDGAEQARPEERAYDLAGQIAVAGSPKARAVLEKSLERNAVRVVTSKEPLPRGVGEDEIARRRLGLYQPWMPSMDEGWTRLVLEEFGFSYTTLHNAEVRPGKLRERFEVIVIPSIPENVLRDGFAKDATSPAHAGGIGVEGAAALREFVNEGGTVIGLEDSCNYLIRELNLPVKNVLAGLRSSDFYGPGSILSAEVSKSALSSRPWYVEAILWGVPDRLSVYFDRSLAFEAANTDDIIPLLRYSPDRTLESGWLHGASRIQGKIALARVQVGGGAVILFGFPPQHRGQTRGTFRLLFNAILRG